MESVVPLKSDLVLGIETSCDETAAAVVAGGRDILSNIISSQIAIHQRYGGVVPEIASRHHLEQINWAIDLAMKEAGVSLADLGGIAVTCGPGLVGALLVGVSTAKGLAYASGLPLVGINHMEAHLMANLLGREQPKLPALALLVSGGHTQLILWQEDDTLSLLGSSRDDAAGEALDKFARVLGLGYPGGPLLEKAALRGDPQAYRMPPPAFEGELDFSFSGIKTAGINLWRRAEQTKVQLSLADLAASYQAAIVNALVRKTEQALHENEVETLLIAGGVAANMELRKALQQLCEKTGTALTMPSLALCTDNAAMVAAAGFRRLSRGERASLALNAYPGLEL